ncbi:hypothetical protein ACFQX6_43885 [Streptosporangium lutulentum]
MGALESIMVAACCGRPCSISDMIVSWRPSRSRWPTPRCEAMDSAASVHRPTLARALAPSISRATHSSVQIVRWSATVRINGDRSTA